MLIRPEEREGYLRFVDLNTSLWRIEDGVWGDQASDRIVLVDLLSHDLHQVIRALYVGKILQRSLRCRAVGLVGNLLFSRDLAFGYDKAEAMRLARSYGVTEFIDLEEAGPSDITDGKRYFTLANTAQAIAAVRECADDGLPDLILSWRTPAGCRVGEYIYETVPRITLIPFLTETRARLEDVTREAHRIHNIIVAACAERKIEAFTTGHISYAQWGMVADLIIRNGGKTIWFDCTGNFSAFLLTRAPEGTETLSSLVRKIDRDLFENAFRERGRLSKRFVSKVKGLFSSDYFLRPFWWNATKPPPKGLLPVLRRIALAKLGWPDAQCPVVCMFVHCLSDLPRDDEQIYLDYYVWFVETLKIAVRDTSRKWIFKTHPANKGGYDKTNATERLKEEYKEHSHIFFLDDELEKVEVFAVCDLAITVRGSITYEMSVYGKPVVLAGRSIFSDLGFAHVAHNTEEYVRLLGADIQSLALTDEMRARADFYLIYDKIASRIESTFMPYWTYTLTGDANIWDALTERVLHNISDLDSVVPAVQAMVEGGAARTQNPRYQALLTQGDRAQNREEADARPQTVALGEPITFARERDGLLLLLAQPIKTDEDGSWFGRGREAYAGLMFDPGALGGGPLALQLTVFWAPADCTVKIEVNGRPLPPVKLPQGGVHVIPVDITDDLTDGGAIVFRACVLTPAGEDVHFRLDRLSVEMREPQARPGLAGKATRWLQRVLQP